MDWSRVDCCDVFISCLDSHSDGTHSLQSIHRWASDVTLHFSKSDLMNKQIQLYGKTADFELCLQQKTLCKYKIDIHLKATVLNAYKNYY